MKPKHIVVVLILILMFLQIGCNSKLVTNNTEPAPLTIESPPAVQPNVQATMDNKVDTTAPQKKNDDNVFDTYTNARYGYKISYPHNWTTGAEADNGDGKILYIGNPDVDIRVYASHHIEGISDNKDQQGFQYQRLKLNDDTDASMKVGNEDGKNLLDMATSSNGVDYHFYVKVTKDFYKDNEETILKVAKSLNVPKEMGQATTELSTSDKSKNPSPQQSNIEKGQESSNSVNLTHDLIGKTIGEIKDRLDKSSMKFVLVKVSTGIAGIGNYDLNEFPLDKNDTVYSLINTDNGGGVQTLFIERGKVIVAEIEQGYSVNQTVRNTLPKNVLDVKPKLSQYGKSYYLLEWKINNATIHVLARDSFKGNYLYYPMFRTIVHQ